MTFAEPEWLLGLILIPLLAGVAWLAWHKRGTRWRRLVAPRLEARLSQTRPAWVYFTSLGMALAGWGALVIAVAQPESGEEWIEIENEGRNILFCIDISRSMLAEDVSPSRLLASRAAALEILEKFPNDRVGVLLFSGTTLVQSPLTLDHGFVEQTLAQLNPDDIPLGGSDLAQAIASGTRLLSETGQQTNIMVVFSDGEKSSEGLNEAAEEAAGAGVFIYALGMGTTEGAIIPDRREKDGQFRDRNGNVVFSRLDEQVLETLAEETNGYYSRGMGADFLIKLDRALAEMDRFQEEGKHQRVAKPAHRWFALSGIILLMGSLIIRSLPLQHAVVLLALVLSMPKAQGGPAEDALIALENGEGTKAHQYFSEAARKASGDRAARLHLSAGSAAAQARDWELALGSFSEALVSGSSETQHSAHYGLATALFYSGVPLKKEEKIRSWRGALNHYEAALKIKADHQSSIDNRAAVKKYLDQLEEKPQPEEPEKETPQDPPPNEKDKEKENNEKENSDSGEKPDQQASEAPDKDPKENEENDPQPGESDQKKEGESDPGKEPGDQKPGEQEPDDQTPKSGDPQDEQESGDEGSGEMIDDPNAPENESPEERARRLVRQFSDLGAKAPRRIRRPYHRNAQDW